MYVAAPAHFPGICRNAGAFLSTGDKIRLVSHKKRAVVMLFVPIHVFPVVRRTPEVLQTEAKHVIIGLFQHRVQPALKAGLEPFVGVQIQNPAGMDPDRFLPLLLAEYDFITEARLFISDQGSGRPRAAVIRLSSIMDSDLFPFKVRLSAPELTPAI